MNIFFPGFFPVEKSYKSLFDVFEKENLQFEFVNYSKVPFSLTNYRVNFHNYIDSIFKDIKNIRVNLIAFSLGAQFLLDYLSGIDQDLLNQKLDKLILIDPLLHKIYNYPLLARDRINDSKLSSDYRKSYLSDFNFLEKFLVLPAALMQMKLNREIDLNVFNFNLDAEVVFLWGEKDTVVRMSYFEQYKEFFKNPVLIKVPNAYHDWLKHERLIKKHLISNL